MNPDGHKTSYLWEDILHPNNLMELINNFIHEQETTEKVYDPRIGAVKDVKHRVLVFPRYHQLDVIRKLKAAIVEAKGVGHNYLIQHTTGSGKSNSIAWLAHLLTHLYRSPTDTNRIFASIIVVTDRRVLDKQLQETIKQVAQVDGVVHPVDADFGTTQGLPRIRQRHHHLDDSEVQCDCQRRSANSKVRPSP